ncbi:MAG TPA: Gfo/Idh/MocA family oxidoreductase [Steroidobacteraceae bacterium]|nr:Gfo/Idh/MocA family oxidoreductase [Steroidobacteraceae bacterium]
MEVVLRFLVVGLGSMGKRRVRNLLAMDYKDVAGFDLRADRRAEAEQKSGVRTFADFDTAIAEHKPDALVISTPPQYHFLYADKSFALGKPCFVEASVVDADKFLALYERSLKTDILVAPSCTMRYYPGPKKVKELIRAGAIGKPLNFNYTTGQYLPDWHPWEKVEDFYVSNRDTGACREIVPFELTWLNDIFGDAEPLACSRAKVTDINADIDDVYHCLLRYPGNMLANLTVEVVSRPKATREFRVLGSEGQIVFSGEERCVRYCNLQNKEWVRHEWSSGTVESNYINPEEPYIAELGTFVNAVKQRDRSLYPNSLKDDHGILQTLYRLEELSGKNA